MVPFLIWDDGRQRKRKKLPKVRDFSEKKGVVKIELELEVIRKINSVVLQKI